MNFLVKQVSASPSSRTSVGPTSRVTTTDPGAADASGLRNSRGMFRRDAGRVLRSRRDVNTLGACFGARGDDGVLDVEHRIASTNDP